MRLLNGATWTLKIYIIDSNLFEMEALLSLISSIIFVGTF